jgi:SAM-dependent methyltransferase
MTIDYDHERNRHTTEGAAIALSRILGIDVPTSLLDVGCGTGTWLRAAVDLGVKEVFGVDGVLVAQERLHVEQDRIKHLDLSMPFDLGRRFDVALCLEVAEHLPEVSSEGLISSIVAHSDSVLFSAACPGQPGQHHVNCQWPAYWQSLFNKRGFVCDDSIRWKIWNDSRVEVWYRQNIFSAHRDRANAGREPQLKAVIHPELFHDMARESFSYDAQMGGMPASWYVTTPPRAAFAKVCRAIRRGRVRSDVTGSN